MNKRGPLRERRELHAIMAMIAVTLLLFELGAFFILYLIPSPTISGFPITFRDIPPLFEEKIIDDQKFMVRTKFHPYVSDDLMFPVNKGFKVKRIFCLGGSAAMGWPHDLSYSYPSYLQQKLNIMFPAESFEMINLGASTYGTHRIKALINEILTYEPDLILLYCGNNEFLEPKLFKYSPLPRPWNISSLLTLIDYLRDKWSSDKAIPFGNHRANFMLNIALGNSSPLAKGEDQRKWVQKQFIDNMAEMVDKITVKNVPVYILNVPVNTKDWSPHLSVLTKHSRSPDWQMARRIGSNQRMHLALQEAVNSWKKCIVIDSQHAETLYDIGSSYLLLGKIHEASFYLEQAVDRDAYPFRCLTVFNDQLQNLCIKKQIPLVDIVGKLKSHTATSILGDETLLDHVHPTAKANQRIADSVIEILLERRFITVTSTELKIPKIKVPSNADHNLIIYEHLFLIYRVLRQFDKLSKLLTDLESFDLATRKSSAFMALQDQLKRTIAITDPYHKLIRAQEHGTESDLFSAVEQRKILDNYVALCTRDLAPPH